VRAAGRAANSCWRSKQPHRVRLCRRGTSERGKIEESSNLFLPWRCQGVPRARFPNRARHTPVGRALTRKSFRCGSTAEDGAPQARCCYPPAPSPALSRPCRRCVVQFRTACRRCATFSVAPRDTWLARRRLQTTTARRRLQTTTTSGLDPVIGKGSISGSSGSNPVPNRSAQVVPAARSHGAVVTVVAQSHVLPSSPP